MDMNNKYKSISFGALLIIFGAALILKKLGIFYFSWNESYPILLLFFGTLSFFKVNVTKRKEIFWASFLTLAGIFSFLRNYDIIHFLWYLETFHVLLCILGLAFFTQFLFSKKDWGFLIPSVIFFILGLAFILDDFNINLAEIVDYEHYWPVALIFIGIYVIFNSMKKSDKDVVVNNETQEVDADKE